MVVSGVRRHSPYNYVRSSRRAPYLSVDVQFPPYGFNNMVKHQQKSTCHDVPLSTFSVSFIGVALSLP